MEINWTQYTLHLSEQSKTADTIILQAQISSQQAAMKLPTFHYRAEIHLIKKII